MALGFYLDMTMCIGCRACQVACKDKNNLRVGILFRNVHNYETGAYPNSKLYHYSSACYHCTDAKCVKGCPTGAMHYAKDGTVQHDDELCIGCQYCVWNCPYEAPQYIDELNIVKKCDSCKDIRDAGENPACVDACPMRCLEFGDLDELRKKHGADLVTSIPILPTSSSLKPSILIKPRSYALELDFVEKEV